jgi:predicted amidophosphoribosyltransferase
MLRYVDNLVYRPRRSARDVRPPLEHPERVYGDCPTRVERLPDPLCTPKRSMIRRHGYDCDQALTGAIAQCIGEAFPLAEHDCDPVIPVGLHRARPCWRVLKQAALLRVAITRQMGTRLDTGNLIRTRAGSVPTAKNRQERSRPVHKAFWVGRSARIANRRIPTTTAPPSACARVLLAVGARRVDVLTLGREL